MQPDHTIAQWLQAIFAVQHIKERPPNSDVFVECCRGNLVGLCLDGEGQALLRLPAVDSLDEQYTTCEGSVTNATNSLMRECCFHGIRESDATTPGIGQLARLDCRDALDVVPDDSQWSSDVDGIFRDVNLVRIENSVLPRNNHQR